ncbi:hypothetical protein BUALT_Bualt02G0099300 [Buddleja alternifolia]|uniref:RBR-type E3 ubiquitin transferase n=1 Tax=Buddleja alternifolia TaxID=168488 RepID=A0AAV6Y148_9LAMI|nr:hypothetical protein BUALT_Bualt02G0099300 [Buddleja alternifolia]
MEIQPIALSCDDSCISLLYNDDLINNSADMMNHDTLIPDDMKYAQELQLQEVLMASLSITPHSTPQNSENKFMEIGESSEKGFNENIGESSQSICEICAEKRDGNQMFAVKNCTHHYCTECISKHIAIKLQKSTTSTILNNQEKARFLITCPAGIDCKGVLEIDNCREIVAKDVVTMWDDVICESMIDPKHKFYCPYKDCSALLVNDGGDLVVVREAECPFCRRLFCANCYVPWHCGVECEEFLRMNEHERKREDLMVHELAKMKKWQRCPNCKFFVEKNQGCLHMTCR